jgi:hypothetical protein
MAHVSVYATSLGDIFFVAFHMGYFESAMKDATDRNQRYEWFYSTRYGYGYVVVYDPSGGPDSWDHMVPLSDSKVVPIWRLYLRDVRQVRHAFGSWYCYNV